MNYNQAVEFIQSFPDMERGTAPADSLTMSLETMKSLLNRLGNPQAQRATIHVTGSKGKSSVSTMIASILNCSKLPSALYTSPHLHSYRERIAVNGKPVTEEIFARGITEIAEAVLEENETGSSPVVSFAVLTALFFHLARTSCADWQVVEVGLGGALDATNVFAGKEIAVITPVSLEHTRILGNTPQAIAQVKAGIIVPGCTAICAPQKDPAVSPVIKERCAAVGASFVDVEACYEWQSQPSDNRSQSCRIAGPGGLIEFDLPLAGEHQLVNAVTAVAAGKNVPAITAEAIEHGLNKVAIAGRLELLGEKPQIVADGAHNQESARALREALVRHFKFRHCFLVLGVNADKDVSAIIAELSPLARLIIATRSQNPRSLAPAKIKEAAAAASIEAVVSESLLEALRIAESCASADDLIVATGSLYVAGEAREHLLCLPGHR